MKALTVCQPYATLIARGLKRVENRTWPAPQWAIGKTIAIHAGKSKKFLALNESGLRDAEYGIRVCDMPFGAVVATARLVECVSLLAARSFPEKVEGRFKAIGWSRDGFLDHDHTEGPFCWIFGDVQPLATPLSISGAQGLWDVSDYLLSKVPA